MRTRVVSALVGLLFFIPIMISGGSFFAYTMLILGILGMYELAKMQGIQYFSFVGLVASLMMVIIVLPQLYLPSFLQGHETEYLIYIAVMLLLVVSVLDHHRFSFVDAAVLTFGALYIGCGFKYLILIRQLGLETIIYQFLVIWATDTGAYLLGSAFGKHKLAPEISPNKSVEGAIGGIVTALLASQIYLFFFDPNLGPVNSVWMLTVALSVTGQLGDLVESAYKRHFKVKDSGHFLPGHGGVLDRFDSIIFTSFLFMIWINLS